jgi:hypothetical protein
MAILIAHPINWELVAEVTGLTLLSLGTLWGILCTFIAEEFRKDADAYKERLQASQGRLENTEAILTNYRNNREVHTAYEYAREWENRYRLQMQICETAHIERPLPTMSLSAEQARELEEGLPF